MSEFENEMTRQKMTEKMAAQHAMQSGVLVDIENQFFKKMIGDTHPQVFTYLKHLRVGVNTALCDIAALVELLVKKGVFEYIEYLEESVARMKQEVKDYEKRLSKELGTNVTLM